MKLTTEVLASASIKRKKPWPRIIWVGEVSQTTFIKGHVKKTTLCI